MRRLAFHWFGRRIIRAYRFEEAFFLPLARRFRAALRLPLMLLGGVTRLDTMESALAEGFDSTHIPSYGPESRGGTSYADVHVAAVEVLSPAAPHPHVLVAFNAPSLAKFGPTVRAGGVVIYDSSIITEVPDGRADGVRMVGVPFTAVAKELGSAVVKNIVALGALQGVTQLFPKDTFLAAIRASLGNHRAMLALDVQAFERGAALAAEFVAGP